MTSAGGFPAPFGDLTSRMAFFGHLFAERAGLSEPENVPSPEDLVSLVRTHVPRTTEAVPPEDTPVYEAAAYIGEWLRNESGAHWIAEGPLEPHLQLTDDTGALIYLLPLVSILRTATTAGYDGLAALLRTIKEDVNSPGRSRVVEAIRVHPPEDRPRIVQWIRANRNGEEGTRVALWRRCNTCGTPREESLSMPPTGSDWETEAGVATGLLAQRAFGCACGGRAGDVSRLLMIRRDSETRLADIYVAPTHTRVACWRLRGDVAEPFDARTLATQPAAAG